MKYWNVINFVFNKIDLEKNKTMIEHRVKERKMKQFLQFGLPT